MVVGLAVGLTGGGACRRRGWSFDAWSRGCGGRAGFGGSVGFGRFGGDGAGLLLWGEFNELQEFSEDLGFVSGGRLHAGFPSMERWLIPLCAFRE